MKALRQPEEQHRPDGGTLLTLWPSWSCDRKINSSVACDWGLALRQASLQSSEQRQLLLIPLSHICMAASNVLIASDIR